MNIFFIFWKNENSLFSAQIVRTIFFVSSSSLRRWATIVFCYTEKIQERLKLERTDRCKGGKSECVCVCILSNMYYVQNIPLIRQNLGYDETYFLYKKFWFMKPNFTDFSLAFLTKHCSMISNSLFFLFSDFFWITWIFTDRQLLISFWI